MSADDTPITLTDLEIFHLTGYVRSINQLSELHRRGFWRARMGRTGRVILERAHFEAVCAGLTEHQAPKVRALGVVR